MKGDSLKGVDLPAVGSLKYYHIPISDLKKVAFLLENCIIVYSLPL